MGGGGGDSERSVHAEVCHRIVSLVSHTSPFFLWTGPGQEDNHKGKLNTELFTCDMHGRQDSAHWNSFLRKQGKRNTEKL